MDNPTTISPSEASSASHEVQKAQAATASAIKDTTQAISELIQAILNRTQGKDKAKPSEVEIQVGRHKLYKGCEGDTPLKNSLNPNQVNVLRELINTPSADLEAALESGVETLGGRAVTVRVDKEPVLRIENGHLTNNLLPATREAEIQAPQPEAEIHKPEPETTIRTQIDAPAVQSTTPAAYADLVDQYNSQQFPANALRVAITKDSIDRNRTNPSVPLVCQESSNPDFLVTPVSNNEYLMFPRAKFIFNNLSLDLTAHFFNLDQVQGGQKMGRDVNLVSPARVRLDNGVFSLIEKGEVQNRQLTQQRSEVISHSDLEIQPGVEATPEATNAETELVKSSPVAESNDLKPEPAVAVESPVADNDLKPEPAVAVEAESAVEPPSELAESASELELSQDSQTPPNGSFKQLMADELALTPSHASETPKRTFSHLISAELAQSFKLPPETREWLQQTGQTLKARATQDLQKVSNFAGQVARNHQNRQIAHTALQLLNSDPEGRIFQAEDYRIQAVNRHTISVQDREGQEILRFEESAIGPKILSDNLSPKQIREFHQVRQQIEKHGTEALLSSETPARLSFLLGLSPQGDRAAVKHLQNLKSLDHAANLFDQIRTTPDAQGREMLAIGDYQLTRLGDNIQVSHSQRGSILSRIDGTVQGNLTAQDQTVLRSMHQQLQDIQALSSGTVANPPAKTASAQVELVD